MKSALSSSDATDVLQRAIAAWRAHSCGPLPAHQDTLEEELPYLALDVQVPLAEAIRWLGYDALREGLQRAVRETRP